MSQAAQLRDAIREGNQPLVSAIHDLIAHMKNGVNGKAHSTVERPAWKPNECDAECELTGWPVPSASLEDVDGWQLHPGAARYLREHGHKPEEEPEVPEKYNSIPRILVPAAKAKKGAKLRWELEDLPHMTRPELYMAAADVSLNKQAKAVGIDYRMEKSEWLVAAIASVHQGNGVPAPADERNIGRYKPDDALPAEPKAEEVAKPKKGKPKKAAKKSKPALSPKAEKAKANIEGLPDGQFRALQAINAGESARKRDVERLMEKGLLTSTGKVPKHVAEALGA